MTININKTYLTTIEEIEEVLEHVLGNKNS